MNDECNVQHYKNLKYNNEGSYGSASATLITFSDFGEQIINSCIRHGTTSLKYINILTNTSPAINDEIDVDYCHNQYNSYIETHDILESDYFLEIWSSKDFENKLINDNPITLLDSLIKTYHFLSDIVYIVVRDNECDLNYTSTLLETCKALKIQTVVIICRNEKGFNTGLYELIELADTIIDIGIAYKKDYSNEYIEIFHEVKRAVSAVLTIQLAFSKEGIIGVDFADVLYILRHSNYMRVEQLDGVYRFLGTAYIHQTLKDIEINNLLSNVEYVLSTHYIKLESSCTLDLFHKNKLFLINRYPKLKMEISSVPIMHKDVKYSDKILILIGVNNINRKNVLRGDISFEYPDMDESVSFTGTIYELIMYSHQVGFNRIIKVELSGRVGEYEDILDKGHLIRVAQLYDDTADIEIIIYPNIYEYGKSLCVKDNNIRITGALGLKDVNGLCNIVVHSIESEPQI